MAGIKITLDEPVLIDPSSGIEVKELNFREPRAKQLRELNLEDLQSKPLKVVDELARTCCIDEHPDLVFDEISSSDFGKIQALFTPFLEDFLLALGGTESGSN